jgi:hypothetical protein
MIAALLGEVGVAAAAPGTHRAPADPFGLEDAADLAAADSDAFGVGGRSQGVQGPLGRLLVLGGGEGAVGLALKAPGRVAGHQGNDPSALQLPQPPRAARAGQVAEVIQAAGVEAVQPAVDGALVAAELGGDLADLDAIPAQGDDAGALQPARRRVPSVGEPADAALLGRVGGWPGKQRGQHRSPPVSQGTQHIKRAILLHRT